MSKSIATADELGLALDVPIELIRRKRQKYLRIRVKPDRIQVSAPKGTRIADMKAFVVEKYDWVQKQWNRLNDHEQLLRQQVKDRHQQLLWFGEWNPIILKPQSGSRASMGILRKNGNVFEFMHTPNQNLSVDIKEAFYRKQAKRHLPKRAREIAAQHNFRVNRIYIRDQKTKWGSCSSKANISLNWRLICCPKPVIDYLIIHECCHLVHMNHSEQFWNLVENLCPDYKQHEDWLRRNEAILFRLP
jgi:predicted metal-dependent hydrolase